MGRRSSRCGVVVNARVRTLARTLLCDGLAMTTSHWSSLSAASLQTTVESGRLLGDETPVETELTREGDDYEILRAPVTMLRRVTAPPPALVRSAQHHAPILPPARRTLATR